MDDHEPLSFLGRALPPAFDLAETTLAPGGTRPFDEADWCDALVVVERGEIDLECLGGRFQRFRCGDVLWLSGLPLRALHNRGPEAAVLVAVSRRANDEFSGAARSNGQCPLRRRKKA